jgi:hypothetical protein
MKLEGFKFLAGVCLQFESEEFDLHNDFSFAGFTYDVIKRTVTLRWVPCRYAENPRERPRIVIEFWGVSHLSAKARDPAAADSEDECLAAVGHVSASWSMDEGFSWEVPQSEDSHCVISFMSGFLLRICGECATLRME